MRTSHRPKFSSIQFGKAYLGFNTYNYYLHGFLVLLNTYSANIIGFLMLPYMLTTKKTHVNHRSANKAITLSSILIAFLFIMGI